MQDDPSAKIDSVHSSMNSEFSFAPKASQGSIDRQHFSSINIFPAKYSEFDTAAFAAIKQKNYSDDEEPITIQQTTDNLSSAEDSDLETCINLSMRLKKKVVQSSSFSEQTFPMLVSLCADNLKTIKRVPIDLVCVLDHSGSMTGEKMKLVRNTFKYLLKYLNDSDRLSIVIFDDKASRLVPMLRTTEANKKKILAALRIVHGAGGTDINLGMMHAFHVLKQRRYFNPITSIFVLSDGLDEGAQQRVKTSLEKFGILDDVTINTFGFGNDHDAQLMSDIADLRDGEFYFIKQLELVDEAFVDCLGGLLSSVIQSIELMVKPVKSEVFQDIEVVKAYGEDAMWKHEGGIYTTKLLSLMLGKPKDFVLELKIPVNKKELQDHERNVKIASAEAEIVGLDGQHITKKIALSVTFLNETEEMKEEDEEDDRKVMQNFFRLKGASLMKEAKKLADQNKNEEAKKILKYFKEELENSFLKEEKFIKNLMKDIEGAIEYVNPQVFSKAGKHALISNSRAHNYQKTTFDSANYFQNKMQSEMFDELQAMKKE